MGGIHSFLVRLDWSDFLILPERTTLPRIRRSSQKLGPYNTTLNNPVVFKADTFRFEQPSLTVNLGPIPLPCEATKRQICGHDPVAWGVRSERIPPQCLTYRSGRTATDRLRQFAVCCHPPFGNATGH
jgi:hypothetical protein